MHRKCAFHINSYPYVTQRQAYEDIVQSNQEAIMHADLHEPIHILIALHFMAPLGSFNKQHVFERAQDMIQSLNDDFNNYTTNPNMMHNFKYKNIVNRVFLNNMPKQNIYLSTDYVSRLPVQASNITFELGEIYYYAIRHPLNLSAYDVHDDVELEQQMIRKYITQHRAEAIQPKFVLNLWVIDTQDKNVMGIASFPWEAIDMYHGVVINRRIMFPEEHDERLYGQYKTLTHQIGHYLGLLHVTNQNSFDEQPQMGNINESEETAAPVLSKPQIMTDPTDTQTNQDLHFTEDYNPLFMNFMDFTGDRYVTMFTKHQIQIMRYMLQHFLPSLNHLKNKIRLNPPRYNPDTDTIVGGVASTPVSTPIKSHDPLPDIPLPTRAVPQNMEAHVTETIGGSNGVYASNMMNEAPNLTGSKYESSGSLLDNIHKYIPNHDVEMSPTVQAMHPPAGPSVHDYQHVEYGYATHYGEPVAAPLFYNYNAPSMDHMTPAVLRDGRVDPTTMNLKNAQPIHPVFAGPCGSHDTKYAHPFLTNPYEQYYTSPQPPVSSQVPAMIHAEMPRSPSMTAAPLIERLSSVSKQLQEMRQSVQTPAAQPMTHTQRLRSQLQIRPDATVERHVPVPAKHIPIQRIHRSNPTH